MTYRELLNLYKQGKLEEEKQRQVEADIEKQDAISEYLYEQAEIPGLDELSKDGHSINKDRYSTGKDGDSADEDGHSADNDRKALHEEESLSEARFVRMMQRSIRRAFIKMGTIVGVIVLAVVLFVVLALPNVVSLFYYDPGRMAAGDTNQMSLDMAVYSELFLPMNERDHVSVERRGYGNYDICIYQNVSYTDRFTNVSGKVEQGKLTLYDTNTLQKPTGNLFEWFQQQGDLTQPLSEKIPETSGNVRFAGGIAGTPQEATEKLQQLDERDYYLAYVTLDRMLPYEAFYQFVNGQEELYAEWCAIQTNDNMDDGTLDINGIFRADNIGFKVSMGSSTSVEWDHDKYPYLKLWEDTAFEENREEEYETDSEDFMKQHFISMLRYMQDQEAFCEMMSEEPEYFREAADYIEENGLTVYGFATIADKETLLKLNEADEVYTIAVTELN